MLVFTCILTIAGTSTLTAGKNEITKNRILTSILMLVSTSILILVDTSILINNKYKISKDREIIEKVFLNL